MKLISAVGARPQFVKVAPILRAIADHNAAASETIDHVLVHTGQHYDYELSQAFFVDLDLPAPDYNLDVGSSSHGQQTGEMLSRVEKVLQEENPDLVLVYGDTNSTLAAAIAAVKLHIPVAHVEAGLRDYDKHVPEEVNRLLTDHVSAFLFCPSRTAVRNLQREGFGNAAFGGDLAPLDGLGNLSPCDLNHPLVINTGDVMVDALLYNMRLAEEWSTVLRDVGLLGPDERPMEYLLTTVHRAENTDDPRRLAAIFTVFDRLAAEGLKVVIPLHPRTRKALSGLARANDFLRRLKVIPPVPYKDMLMLERHARVVLTDSGGVQKEAFLLRVPCVTLREVTAWVETIEAGWNRLVGADAGRIVEATRTFLREGAPKISTAPYGDGHAAERIVKLCSNLESMDSRYESGY